MKRVGFREEVVDDDKGKSDRCNKRETEWDEVDGQKQEVELGSRNYANHISQGTTCSTPILPLKLERRRPTTRTTHTHEDIVATGSLKVQAPRQAPNSHGSKQPAER